MSVSFNVDVSLAVKKLRKITVPDAYVDPLKAELSNFLREFQAASPIGSTGELARGWQASVVSGQPNPNSATLVVSNTKPNALKIINWLKQGTRSHKIRPSRLVLHFFPTRSGDEVFTRKPVNHPGTKPVMAMRSLFEQRIAVVMQRIVAAIVKNVEQA